MAAANPKQISQWSWLIMRQNRSEYYCPPDLKVSTDTFCKELSSALQENSLPAKAELVDVDWDDSGTVQRRATISYTGKETSRDILQVFIGVDQVGRFAYVETKTCIRPPDLPTKPRDPMTGDSGWGCLWPVAIMAVVGFFVMASGQFIGALLVILGVIGVSWVISEMNKERQWNAAAAAERSEWGAAWDTWAEKRLRIAYLTLTDDIYGRFTDAVLSTVTQTAKKLLLDRNAELRKEIEEQKEQKEIEAEMEKRRKEALT